VTHSIVWVIIYISFGFDPFCYDSVDQNFGVARRSSFSRQIHYRTLAVKMRLSHRLARSAVLHATKTPITISLQKTTANRLWQRSYSIKPVTKGAPELPGVDPAKLKVTTTTTPKDVIPNEQLVFGQTFTGESLRRSGL
jgi:hypothetical protein